MRCICIGTLVLLALAVVIESTVVVRTALAQRPKVVKSEGHVSPVEVRITFPDGQERTGLLVGTGSSHETITEPSYTHTINGTGAGESAVTIWLDTISMIEDSTETEALIRLKGGKERTLSFTFLSNTLFLANEDGGREKILLSKIKQVEFLKPPRKDKAGNAMFDDWRYSPYTGEKLP